LERATGRSGLPGVSPPRALRRGIKARAFPATDFFPAETLFAGFLFCAVFFAGVLNRPSRVDGGRSPFVFWEKAGDAIAMIKKRPMIFTILEKVRILLYSRLFKKMY
jgi:hypothetical protein